MMFEDYTWFTRVETANCKHTNAILDICQYHIHSRLFSMTFYILKLEFDIKSCISQHSLWDSLLESEIFTIVTRYFFLFKKCNPIFNFLSKFLYFLGELIFRRSDTCPTQIADRHFFHVTWPNFGNPIGLRKVKSDWPSSANLINIMINSHKMKNCLPHKLKLHVVKRCNFQW